MTVATASPSITTDEALSLIEETIKQSHAEEVAVCLSNSEDTLTRYSENQITQNVSGNQFKLAITSYFGRRSATVTTTEFDPEAIADTLRRSEDLARIAPEDPEWVPPVGPQTYPDRPAAFDEATATFSPLARGEKVRAVCEQGARAGVEMSGTLSTEVELVAVGNSRGVRVCDRHTAAEFSVTARIDTGSGWTGRRAWNMDGLPLEPLTETVIRRALDSRNPREIEPGVYPVIFDGAAFSSLLMWVVWNLDARAADEGRSFMSRTDSQGQPAGNLLGEPLLSPLVNVRRNPAHPLIRGYRFSMDGLSKDDLTFVENGVPQNLIYSHYWASQHNQTPTGSPWPVVMAGTDQSVADLVAQTERGILVNRAWYVRYINPKTLEVTGMTRDGTFWIENGKIAYPIKNMRFNQSLPHLLRDVDALSSAARYDVGVVPGVRVKAFNFSSITDSV